VETDEPLETGYGAGTPPGDNACNDYAQGLADAYGGLARARREVVRDDGDVLLTDGGSPSLFGNVAVLREPPADDGWRTLAARLHVFYGQRHGGPFLVFSAWPTPDLTGLDFGRIGHPPLMLRPAGPVTVDALDGVEIRPVDGPTAARDWEWALVHAFPLEELQPFRVGSMLPPAALAPRHWRHWVAYLDDEPAGTASAFLGDHHVDVEFISTLETARGRGIGRALTATAVSVAPDRPAMLVASDLGRSLYERLGFRSILRFTMWAGHRNA
jgi:GNAT superfamily N-acetyltransferase